MEAGTNDIVVLPILLVLIAIAHADLGGVSDWLVFVTQLFVLGPAAGFAVGAAGSWVMGRGTTRHFGGSSKAGYGPLLQTVYPAAGFTTVLRYNNFNSGDRRNPCPVR